jgi:Uma2 family endonuclease
MPLDLLELAMPIAVRPAAPVTDEELMRFSSVNHAYRIEQNKEGEITIMTPVGGIGGINEFLVLSAIAKWIEAKRDGISFSPNIGFRLADGSCLSPDGCWVAIDRWKALTPAQQRGFLPLCPDFVVEVRSETDRRKPLEQKMQLWMENGARLAWLIDPLQATVTIYGPGLPERTLYRPDSVEAGAPLEGFVLETSRFWQAE